MITVAQQLGEIIENAKAQLSSIPERRASDKPYPDKWSIKETLGHLIDSASNNHQRIVRMQEISNIGTFTYSQMHWVDSQHYQSESWDNVVELWYRYNKHLAHIIAHIDPLSLNNVCDVRGPAPLTLQAMVEDYLRHLNHHLGQIFEDTDPTKRRKWAE